MKRKQIIVLAVAAVIAVAAVVLLIVGLTTHRERTLLEVCWSPDGRAGYLGDVEKNESVTCTGHEELVWPRKQLPITLTAVEDLEASFSLSDGDRRVKVLRQAIQNISRELGFEAFVWTPVDTTSSIVYFGGAVNADPSPGHIAHRRTESGLEADVFIRSDVESSDRLLYRVLMHELLHVLGLAHDDFQASIMFPVMLDDTVEGSMSAAHVTDVDRARLRELYGRIGNE